ncbi:hypothetical protein HanIR_Chr14g0696411 [Helianthus annuus]|nr:hypothetical protein HanIR_Chr14g0696411 [Helianthus annuus]
MHRCKFSKQNKIYTKKFILKIDMIDFAWFINFLCIDQTSNWFYVPIKIFEGYDHCN